MRYDIRKAILDTADLFEHRPRLYNFFTVTIPKRVRKSAPRACGSPGCVLGWIGAFLGLKQAKFVGDVEAVTGVEATTFYGRMDAICGGRGTWMHDAHVCATALRKYADQYYPEGQ